MILEGPRCQSAVCSSLSTTSQFRRRTGADANFYLHEAAEATMMGRGLGYDAAHAAALNKYGVSPFSLYHPDVIQANPGLFNSTMLGGPLGASHQCHENFRPWTLVNIGERESGLAHFQTLPTPLRTLSRKHSQREENRTKNRDAAIELFVPLGPRFMYGFARRKVDA